jgi:hypothetical protein
MASKNNSIERQNKKVLLMWGISKVPFYRSILERGLGGGFQSWSVLFFLALFYHALYHRTHQNKINFVFLCKLIFS